MKRETEEEYLNALEQDFMLFLSREGSTIGKLILILLIALFLFLLPSKHKTTIEEAPQDIDITPVVAVPGKHLGKFSISHYCSCPICTQTPKGSKTATGHIPREGRTVAVDPKIIPLHSVIYVEDLGTFVAEDVGGAVKGNHLDIYISDHQRALNLGTLQGAKKEVYILE
jgi:3D (Asp-Asp-Asp) domain-containing protein